MLEPLIETTPSTPLRSKRKALPPSFNILEEKSIRFKPNNGERHTTGYNREVMDSYTLPLKVYQPLIEWTKKHWKSEVMNTISVQSLFGPSCGDYAITILRERDLGQAMREFPKQFPEYDYICNSYKVGQMLNS